MAALIERLAPRRVAGSVGSFDDWVGLWGLGGLGMFLQTTMANQQEETPDGTFASLVAGGYLRNPVVFSSLAIRARLFSDATFRFQQMRNGQPGNLFGTPALRILERPEPGKTTRDLLQSAILDADLGGNGFILGRTAALRRERPDWMSIAYGSRGRATELGSWDPDAEIIGFGYHPGGYGSGEKVITFGPDEICHFAPTKDPLCRNRGISLLTAGLQEIMADNGATRGKLAFFNNAMPQPLDAKVLTPDGWTIMGAIEVGDQVTGRDGKAHPVVGVYPQGERDIYRVTFSGGGATECTADHVWQVASIADRKVGTSRTMTLAEMMAGGVRYKSGPAKWSVPLVEPVEFTDPGPLPVDPYLLGILLGDGSFRNGTVTFSTSDAEVVESVRELVPAGVEVRHQKEYEYHLRAGGRGIKRNPAVALAKKLGLWNVLGYAKAIPEPYLRASVFDREALLQGLIDSDGHIEAASSVGFANTSEVLVRQVAELANSLGARTRVRAVPKQPGHENWRPQWFVRISRLPDWIVPCRLSRKRVAYRPAARFGRYRYITAVERVGRKPAQCIKLDAPEPLYVTDDYIVTHNTPNLAVKFPSTMKKAAALEWIELAEQEHRGITRGFKTIYFGGGVEPTPVGLGFGPDGMDFAKIQARAETRIAALTGMHPVVAALSEGLQGSSLNAGNFGSAARLVGDATLRPLWGDMAGSLETIIRPPRDGTRLWFDDRSVAFLRSDVADQADIIQKQGATIGQLVKDGFTPESSVAAVVTGDMNLLVHTGMTSVQLLPPLSQPAAAYRAPREFWSIDVPYASMGTIQVGTIVPAGHPILAAYPSMFEPVPDLPQLPARAGGPGQIVTREQVVTKRIELLRLGQPAGHNSVARALLVSPDTVRRRLKQGDAT